MKSKTVSTNGTSAESHATEAAHAEGGGLPLERAEELVDRMNERVSAYASKVGTTLSRWVARVREEFEDIVAEADSLRRGDPPQ